MNYLVYLRQSSVEAEHWSNIVMVISSLICHAIDQTIAHLKLDRKPFKMRYLRPPSDKYRQNTEILRIINLTECAFEISLKT